MKRVALLFLVLVCFVASSLLADIYTYPVDDPVISVTYPDDWKIEPDEEVLHASPADETVYVGVWGLKDVESVEDALDALGEEIEDFVSITGADDPEVKEINGMDFVYVMGTGTTADDVEVVVTVVVFSPNNEDYFLGFVFGTPDSIEEYGDVLDSILMSIKKS